MRRPDCSIPAPRWGPQTSARELRLGTTTVRGREAAPEVRAARSLTQPARWAALQPCPAGPASARTYQFTVWARAAAGGKDPAPGGKMPASGAGIQRLPSEERAGAAKSPARKVGQGLGSVEAPRCCRHAALFFCVSRCYRHAAVFFCGLRSREAEPLTGRSGRKPGCPSRHSASASRARTPSDQRSAPRQAGQDSTEAPL
jgi:hypothetical protein